MRRPRGLPLAGASCTRWSAGRLLGSDGVGNRRLHSGGRGDYRVTLSCPRACRGFGRPGSCRRGLPRGPLRGQAGVPGRNPQAGPHLAGLFIVHKGPFFSGGAGMWQGCHAHGEASEQSLSLHDSPVHLICSPRALALGAHICPAAGEQAHALGTVLGWHGWPRAASSSSPTIPRGGQAPADPISALNSRAGHQGLHVEKACWCWGGQSVRGISKLLRSSDMVLGAQEGNPAERGHREGGPR